MQVSNASANEQKIQVFSFKTGADLILALPVTSFRFANFK